MPEILVLLARIIGADQPRLVEMVVLYLGNVATLIDGDEK